MTETIEEKCQTYEKLLEHEGLYTPPINALITKEREKLGKELEDLRVQLSLKPQRYE